MRQMMVRDVALTLMVLLAPSSAIAQPPVAPAAAPTVPAPPAMPSLFTPLPGGPSFISPAGEPVASPDKLSGAEHWFAATDSDRDGRLTRKEIHADAARFFDRLDVDHDGELGSAEIERYEFQVAPEIRVTSTSAGVIASGDDGGVKEAPYPDRIGAGRYGYIDLPEPIIAMDTNFDRGVSRAEFDAAIDARFDLLDTDGNGVITRAELPRIVAGNGKRARRGPGGAHDGGHRRGGFGGHGGGGGGGGGGDAGGGDRGGAPGGGF